MTYNARLSFGLTGVFMLYEDNVTANCPIHRIDILKEK